MLAYVPIHHKVFNMQDSVKRILNSHCSKTITSTVLTTPSCIRHDRLLQRKIPHLSLSTQKQHESYN